MQYYSGLKVTLDPFFLHLFNPELHPGRLERLLSSILGQEVKVVKIFPRFYLYPS